MEASIARELYASQKQQDRSQLPRVLYIPCHSDTTSHLALYHTSSWWIEATGDGAPLAYTVKFTTRDNGIIVGKLEYHVQPDPTVADKALVEIDSAQPTDPVAIGISYPIPLLESQGGTAKLPYFHFRMPSGTEMTQFDWQVQPVEHEPLRYTLMRRSVDETETKAEIHATYHHRSTRLSHSEGIFLLPPCTDPRSEAMVVASVLGMLWRLRFLDGGRENKKALKMIKRNIFGSP
ncbi:hypothetical protein CNMCM6936_008796 [Aspergillus lentulus]|uniref:Uncharacterized protein n=1 Tax=Aspergillus lentulus TaxID=293939 RepID=A0ABQ0ZVI1_ASPLE|nr:hypothetical protein CNMCM6936_008796 [Aspergillus lentulus]KAF4177588.1 hypothetical protein CNMCM8060_005381 [Aspergillus lentulus]KAF4199567.1 hypothetical protein CNMCM8694_003316 [Aspergillus lentulus]GFF65676.1 hypothetical protein IFM60648_01668 [Aspergillus lentulus]